MIGKKNMTFVLTLALFLAGFLLAGSSEAMAAANLAWGSHGDNVVQLQQTLNSRGYWCGTVDGIFGSNTYQGVIRFQTDAGLEADGIVGPQTRAALAGAVSGGSQVSRGGTDIRKYSKISKVNGSYGQFRYRELSGGRIEVDPAWIAKNIVTIKLPGLNRNVQVHKSAADNFIKAFTYIKNGTATVNGKQVTLLSLIDTMDGTFVTRHVNWNAANGLSNHSWGTAMDINASDHFRYVKATERSDPNLILWEKAFKPAGFSWGNTYSDAMHYELLR